GAGQTRGDVAHVAVGRDALDAAGDRHVGDPAPVRTEAKAAVVGHVERAVGPARCAVGTAAGRGDRPDGAVVVERDASAADLDERDALRTETGRTIEELETCCEQVPRGRHRVSWPA